MEQDLRDLRTHLRSSALLWALGLGVLASALIMVDGRPGLNVALWALAGVAVLVILLDRRGTKASRESQWLVAGALFFAVLLLLRDAEVLRVFNLFAAVVLLVLAAGQATRAWVAHAQVNDVVSAGLRVVRRCIMGPLGWGWGAPVPDAGAGRWARTILRGAVMALPAVIILLALLMSADPVFSNLMRSVFQFDISPYIGDIVFMAVIAWLTAGFLRAFLIGNDLESSRLRVPEPTFAAAEVSVALWILNLLFLVFMAVQLRYLFGGADVVAVTEGFTYAEYARRGFFELVWAAILVVPVLLLADWAAKPDTERTQNILRASMLVLVLLLLGVLVSAAYRMQLYQDAYGLTEARVYGSAFMLWLTAVLLWLVATVLRGKRERFIVGAIVGALVTLTALHIVNPQAMIVRANIDRAMSGAEYDGAYLTSLDADAVPALLARVAELPVEERCRVAGMLEHWTGDRVGGWRTWNVSDARARQMVRAEAAALKGYLEGCPKEEVRISAPEEGE